MVKLHQKDIFRKSVMWPGMNFTSCVGFLLFRLSLFITQLEVCKKPRPLGIYLEISKGAIWKINSRVHILLRNRCVHFRPGRAKILFACSSAFFVSIICFLVDFRKILRPWLAQRNSTYANVWPSTVSAQRRPEPKWTQKSNILVHENPWTFIKNLNSK